mgnify:CR=1 FL=1
MAGDVNISKKIGIGRRFNNCFFFQAEDEIRYLCLLSGLGDVYQRQGWQYQHEFYVRTLAENGFIQSMSRKGNCIDNGATEQVFGHLKDEFFRGQDWQSFESFKADLDAYITHWNTVRRQVKLRGLTPVEYRDPALQEAV